MRLLILVSTCAVLASAAKVETSGSGYSILSYLSNMFTADSTDPEQGSKINDSVQAKHVLHTQGQVRRTGAKTRQGFQTLDNYGQSTNINPFLFPQRGWWRILEMPIGVRQTFMEFGVA